MVLKYNLYDFIYKTSRPKLTGLIYIKRFGNLFAAAELNTTNDFINRKYITKRVPYHTIDKLYNKIVTTKFINKQINMHRALGIRAIKLKK